MTTATNNIVAALQEAAKNSMFLILNGWNMNNPSPSQIKQARLTAGLTQTQAAALIYKTRRAWTHWESGARNMPPDSWELFLLKSTQVIR